MAVDLDGSGELDFQEFLLGIWNLNTMDDKGLIKFCFEIFDIDKGGTLDMAELDALCRMLTGLESIEGELKKTLDNIDADGDGEVTMDELVSYNVAYPELLSPAFELRLKLQQGIYGKAFWSTLRDKRLKFYGSGASVEEILLSERMKRHAEQAALEQKKAEEQANIDKMKAEEAAEAERVRRLKERDEEIAMRASETETETELREALAEHQKALIAFNKFKEIHQKKMGSQAVEEKELEEDVDFDEVDKKLKHLLVSALSRATAANVMNHANSLRIAEAEVKIATKEFVDAYFDTEIGKKYAVDLLDNEIIVFQRAGGGMITKSVKAKLKQQAYDGYFKKKYDEIVLATQKKYERFHDDMVAENFTLKRDTISAMGMLTAAHTQWGWIENVDTESGVSYYFCPGSGASLWEAPINNVMGTCAECKRALCATLRCAQCGNPKQRIPPKEYCRECDPTVHFGLLSHHERGWILPEELDWRRKKRWFQNMVDKNEKTFYYMDLLIPPDELDLVDNDKFDEWKETNRQRKLQGLKALPPLESMEEDDPNQEVKKDGDEIESTSDESSEPESD